jgi:acetyltransferase-like isoleucine patch superfamily enzyme
MVNLIVKIETAARRRLWFFRGFILKAYLTAHGCKVGKRLKCKQWPIFRTIPWKSISIGDNVTLGYSIYFEPLGSGKIFLDDYVQLTQNNIISATERVYLGKYVALAENVSVRDNDHGLAKGMNPRLQPLISTPVTLKDGCGIGRGCAIFRGVTVEEGVIIGAHCILMRNFKSVPYGIYFGNPPKLIDKRR